MGYAGGLEEWPTYRRIADHTEVIRIVYDPEILPYEQLVDLFFQEHSPTMQSWSKQYRSVILTNSAEQKRIAQEAIFDKSKIRKVYTDVEDCTPFYRAEEYHQKYIEKSQGGRRR